MDAHICALLCLPCVLDYSIGYPVFLRESYVKVHSNLICILNFSLKTLGDSLQVVFTDDNYS